ncbi:MAG: amidohydrolase family protein [Lachnospiraceae bacterium]|nr:amidohydrolase family protein [Lachnospiraceae bacterium]
MLIDMHTHIGGAKVGFVMSEDMILQEMEKYHVDYCIVSNGDSAEFDHELNPLPKEFQVSQKDSFLRTIQFARRNPGKIGIMPWIKPATEGMDEELEQLIRENRDIVKGIKVHPFHSNTFFHSDRMEPYIELAQKYELPVMSHTGGCEAADAKYVYEMALKYPKVNFIMAHMGLGTDNKDAINLMEKADNLYADTAWVPVSSTIEIIKRFGSKRIFFGSDSPIDGVDTYYFNREGKPSMYREYFHGLEEVIGTEAYKDLMYRNAMEFFKIMDSNGENGYE